MAILGQPTRYSIDRLIIVPGAPSLGAISITLGEQALSVSANMREIGQVNTLLLAQGVKLFFIILMKGICI